MRRSGRRCLALVRRTTRTREADADTAGYWVCTLGARAWSRARRVFRHPAPRRLRARTDRAPASISRAMRPSIQPEPERPAPSTRLDSPILRYVVMYHDAWTAPLGPRHTAHSARRGCSCSCSDGDGDGDETAKQFQAGVRVDGRCTLHTVCTRASDSASVIQTPDIDGAGVPVMPACVAVMQRASSDGQHWRGVMRTGGHQAHTYASCITGMRRGVGDSGFDSDRLVQESVVRHRLRPLETQSLRTVVAQVCDVRCPSCALGTVRRTWMQDVGYVHDV